VHSLFVYPTCDRIILFVYLLLTIVLLDYKLSRAKCTFFLPHSIPHVSLCFYMYSHILILFHLTSINVFVYGHKYEDCWLLEKSEDTEPVVVDTLPIADNIDDDGKEASV